VLTTRVSLPSLLAQLLAARRGVVPAARSS